MNEPEEPLRRLARETASVLAELGVRPEDEGWIRAHADAVASLVEPERRGRLPRRLARLWRKLRRVMKSSDI